MSIMFSADQLATRMAYEETSGCAGLLLYVGEAFPNQQNREGSRVWRIRRIYYDDCNRQTAVLYANNSKEFQFSWTLRETYNYE